MNLIQYYEELDAMNAAADRFDGFDRGDADNDWAAEDAARNAQYEAEYEASIDQMMLAGELVYGPDTLEQHNAFLESISATNALGPIPDDDIEF